MRADLLSNAVTGATSKWAKQRKKEDRDRQAASRRRVMYAPSKIDFTEVADDILPGAYAAASGDGKLSASQRQVLYASREQFKARTGNEITHNYFCKLLVQYMNRRPGLGWKITADPRGTLVLPEWEEEVRVPIGTLEIENHLREARNEDADFAPKTQLETRFPTVAPGKRYRGVLFIEKEGFGPQLQEAEIAERFDVAIMSTKGQSTVAARKFIDRVCAKGNGCPLLVLHDMDKSGFEIAQRLTTESLASLENDRCPYLFCNEIDVRDIGIRWEHVEKYDLQPESCKMRGSLHGLDVTDAERHFLESNRRVEINALTSPQLIELIEDALREHLGEDRLVPDDEVLEQAYRRAVAVAHINRKITKMRKEALKLAEEAEIPEDLRDRVAGGITQDEPTAWDEQVYALASGEVKK